MVFAKQITQSSSKAKLGKLEKLCMRKLWKGLSSCHDSLYNEKTDSVNGKKHKRRKERKEERKIESITKCLASSLSLWFFVCDLLCEVKKEKWGKYSNQMTMNMWMYEMYQNRSIANKRIFMFIFSFPVCRTVSLGRRIWDNKCRESINARKLLFGHFFKYVYLRRSQSLTVSLSF